MKKILTILLISSIFIHTYGCSFRSSYEIPQNEVQLNEKIAEMLEEHIMDLFCIKKGTMKPFPELKNNDNVDLFLTEADKDLAEKKSAQQLLVGFALETNNELDNAKKKLKNKKLDFIVLNSLNDKGAGFGHKTNKVTFIDRNNKTQKFGLRLKTEVASDIADKIAEMLNS